MSSKRNESPKRTRSARADGSIGSLVKEIEDTYDVPKGSIVVVKPGPEKRRIRGDATVASLREQWAEYKK
jgi:hypothetical protein